MIHGQEHADEMDRMTAFAADALVDMRSAGEVLKTPKESQQQENAFSAPFFTDEEERREKQQMSMDEIYAVETDLHGITTGMDTMSIAVGNVGSSGVGRPADGGPDGQEGEPGITPNVKDDHHRSPENIQRDLKLLNKEIERIPAADKAAYLTAVQRCPDEAFGGWRWEAFLEERDYDSKRTANFLVEYWKMRLAAFGEDRCYLPMTLAGAMQDEVVGMMAYDPHRVSPVKDAAGRTVIVANPSRRVRSLHSTKSHIRAWWYLLEVIAQDLEAHRCGVVVLVDAKNVNQSHLDSRMAKFAVSALNLFPMSWRALHFMNCSRLYSHIFLPFLKFVVGHRLRHRFKVHTGTISNTVDDMRNYALPPDRLPTEFGGEVVVDIRAWINERYAKEVLQVAESSQDLKEDVEPSMKRIRRQSSPAVSGGSGNVSVAVSPPDQSSHIQPPGVCRKLSSLASMSHIQQQPAGLPEPLPPTPRRPVVEIKMTEEEYILLGHKNGRKADPRMTNAIILKLRNPDMDNFDILIAAGFNYPLPSASKKKEKEMLDDEGVSLRQRKNQLNRRLNQLKPKQEKLAAKKQIAQENEHQQQQQQQQQPASEKCSLSSAIVPTDSRQISMVNNTRPAKVWRCPTPLHILLIYAGTTILADKQVRYRYTGCRQ